MVEDGNNVFCMPVAHAGQPVLAVSLEEVNQQESVKGS